MDKGNKERRNVRTLIITKWKQLYCLLPKWYTWAMLLKHLYIEVPQSGLILRNDKNCTKMGRFTSYKSFICCAVVRSCSKENILRH